ncbi:MAG TPA: membrane protein insertase YidC, partial [Methylophaga sp.]|nr:membrane protein insertase YidC [Methylophaga sp.]
MDNLRTLFIFGLLIVSLLLWEAWQNDYVRPQQVATQSNAAEPSTAADQQDDLPELPAAVSADGLPALPDSDPATASSTNQVRVKTDVIDAMIDLRGADIRKLALLKYPVDVNLPDQPVQFLNDGRNKFFVTQSGLRAEGPA